MRGAVPFTELTPRHSRVRELFGANQIKEPIGIQNWEKKRYISTVSYIDKLFAEVAEKKEKIQSLKRQLYEHKVSGDKDKDKDKTSGQFSTMATQQTI